MIFAIGNVRIVTEAKVERIIMAGSSILSNISRLSNAERTTPSRGGGVVFT
jgi:hypothetical protein